MTIRGLFIFALMGSPLLVSAIPNTFFGNGNVVPIIPAMPRFNAEMTEEFLTTEKWVDWEVDTFSGPWVADPSLGDERIFRMAASPDVFGEVPMAVYAYGEGSELRELVIHFLDAGRYFGYQYGGEADREAREEGRQRRQEFSKHYKHLEKTISERLEDGCGRGVPGALGSSPHLRIGFTDYEWEGFVLRFVAREDFSVSLHIMKKSGVPRSLVDPAILEMRDRDRAELFESRVTETSIGDLQITGLPMFTQGDTPFCGIHTLAMAGYYYGLRISPEALAAGAEFKNTGSAKGSDLIGLYRSTATEVGLRVSVAPDFKMDRAARALSDGRPMIVWRRVSEEREKAHFSNQLVWKKDHQFVLPAPSSEELESYPDKSKRGSPSHASIVTGFNEERGEVIYTEPWGKETRDRRMRVEEMEATAYAVFSFK